MSNKIYAIDFDVTFYRHTGKSKGHLYIHRIDDSAENAENNGRISTNCYVSDERTIKRIRAMQDALLKKRI